MKKVTGYLLSFAMILSILSLSLNASAALPTGYWPYYTAYESAVSSGNMGNIMSTGDALLSFFSKYPMDRDIAGMSYNIYYYRYTSEVYEKKGNYDAAIQNARELEYFANYLGFTDMAIAAHARASKIDPMTEVYALSNSATPAAYFGAKNEPQSGTYFGRVASFGTGSKLRNATDIDDESAVSFYVELGKNTAADFSWAIGPYDDGKHIIHIALNFPDEAATASQIVGGVDDSNIKTTLTYLDGLHCPVFLRIGGEMNLWEMDSTLFKNAYIHVAGLARTIAPNVALVWSPNYVGSWGSAVSDFYPGDDYVDWVGASLYCNSAPNVGQNADDDDSMYFGHGNFADCVLSMKDVETVALAHNKPVIITEGGTGIVANATGQKYDTEAALQITKRYTSLNMVYPNIKAIVYFDNDFPGDAYKYALDDSTAVDSAYKAAVSINPTLMSGRDLTKPSYVKLADYCAASGALDIYAYSDTVYSSTMQVTYYLGGSQLASLSALPYHLVLNTATLPNGRYEFKAVFNDGAGYSKTKEYTLTKLEDNSVVFTEGYTMGPDTPADWSKAEVNLAAQNNLIPDVLKTEFSPNITRLNFCRLIINLVERETGKTIDQVLAGRALRINYSAFTDTADKNVLAANALGIVSGRGNGLFDGSAGITREEAAKMLKNAADVLGIGQNSTPVTFADNSSFSSWAVTSINFVSATADKVSNKVVMGGVGNNLFEPKGMYTYQQAYITMLRLLRAG